MDRLKYIFIPLLSLLQFQLFAQHIVLNEAMNNHFLLVRDFDGEEWAWAEVYNPTSQAINLSNYYITNTLSQSGRFRLPNVNLSSGSRRIILFSAKDTQHGTLIHANFIWDRRQDVLFLQDSSLQVIDEIRVPPLPFDHSWGRESDGDSNWVAFSTPTPATPNHQGVKYVPLDQTINIWPPSGKYSLDSVRIELLGSNSGMQIRYTLDGSLPNQQSTPYSGPFWLKPNRKDTAFYAFIPTNPPSADPSWRWREPTKMDDACNVVTAAVFDDSIRRSAYFDVHYFFDNQQWHLPKISIRIDPDDLFDYERGIYVPGATYDLNPSSSSAWGTGNYHNRGRQWERIADVALFEADGAIGFQQKVGVRIHGGGSRTLPLKSLRLYGRFIYGKSHIPYRFFPEDEYDRYDRILLRNGGQGFLSNLFVDALTNKIVEPLNITQQRSRPAEHFINGEYWGVVNLRDRIDERFIAYRYNLPREEVVVIEPIFAQPDGRDTVLAAWLNYLENTEDMNADGVYESVKQYIDVDDFRDYYLSRIFTGIYDWPMNNRRLWRHRDGVLRNIFFDSDDALRHVDANTLAHALEPDGPNWPNAPFSTFMFRKLMENNQFKNTFIERYETLARSIWSPDRTLAIVDSMELLYAPVMNKQINRWGYPRNSVADWQEHIQENRSFLENRHCVLRSYFIEAFDLSNDYLYEYDCSFGDFGERDTILGHVYPNPTEGTVTLDLTNHHDQYVTLKIINSAGQIVRHRSLEQSTGRSKHELQDFEHLPSGVYVLQISGELRTWHTKLIKH